MALFLINGNELLSITHRPLKASLSGPMYDPDLNPKLFAELVIVHKVVSETQACVSGTVFALYWRASETIA